MTEPLDAPVRLCDLTLDGGERHTAKPLPAKTIARIERSEVEKPHGKTLQFIARCHEVDAGQIESYGGPELLTEEVFPCGAT
jgi:hypothetical protein